MKVYAIRHKLTGDIWKDHVYGRKGPLIQSFRYAIREMRRRSLKLSNNRAWTAPSISNWQLETYTLSEPEISDLEDFV